MADQSTQSHQDNSPNSSQSSEKKPTMPPRGPDGKFLSKEEQKQMNESKAGAKPKPMEDKPSDEQEAKVSTKPELDQPVKPTKKDILFNEFYGVKMRKIFKNDEVLFNVEDALTIGQRVVQGQIMPMPPLESLLKKEEFKRIYKEHAVKFKGSYYIPAEFLIGLVQSSGGQYPGSYTRWLINVSKRPFNADVDQIWEKNELEVIVSPV